MFAVVRHPDIEALGIIPDGALETHRARGFFRVSEWRHEPADFHLPEFADADVDLDAPPEPEPEFDTEPDDPEAATAPAETTEESNE